MTLLELTALAFEQARGTLAYLLAYRMAPVLALGASLALIAFSPKDRWLRWARDGGPFRSVAGAAVLGLTRPVSRDEIAANLTILQGRPLATVAYLGISHNLTVYYLFLLGPLLGKDVLLSHVIGVLIFIAVGSALARVLIPTGSREQPPSREPRRSTRELLTEVLRTLGLTGWGLALGGAIAAWGLSSSAVAPAELVESRVASQLLNAVIGVAASLSLWMWPVANLFVGTYLWKIGLAHAGLVTFFCASAASPQRVFLYRRMFGGEVAVRLSLALLLAALVAGLGTAGLFRVSGLTINYKLIPEQLW